MPRPQIVTWLERMRQAESCDFLLTLQKKSFNQVYQKSRSYLGLLACILLDSLKSEKLSTSQLIDKMMAFVAADRKRIENPVKRCLSSHKCFVKMSKAPRYVRSTDFWTLDKKRMTTNVKSHIEATLELFPGFSSNVRLKLNNATEYGLINTVQRNLVAPEFSPKEFKLLLKRCSTTEWQIVALPASAVLCKPTSVACNPTSKSSAQYSGPVSIESLFKEDGPQPYLTPRTAATVFEGFPFARVQSKAISRLQRYCDNAELRTC